MAPEARAPPPSTWREDAAKVADTLRFACSETLGKWPIMDLAFGIKVLSSRQGNPSAASIYAGSNCLQLKGPQIMAELLHFLRLLNLCMSFSIKAFPVFLEYGGYSHEDVLLQQCKAGFLKPAFTILRDRDSKCFLVIIRGMHSMNDKLTAATGYVVPFHYLVLHEGGVSKLVLGYAHFGMVAAARWIAKCATPYLTKAVYEYPAYDIKIVGNSLGGGVASLLTYILREHIGFSSSTCIVFSPASCMTWDLAESSKDFIITVINGSDIVPACSLASLDNLRSEVRASSWIRELWNKHTRFLNVVKHSVLSLRSCLPFLCSRSVSSKPQVVKKSEQNGTQAAAKTRSCVSCCSCIGAHGCAIKICACPKECGQCNEAAGELDFGCSMGREKCTLEESAKSTRVSGGPMKEEEAEGNLKLELEKEIAALKAVAEQKKEQTIAPAVLERHHFFPPGRIVHMVVMPPATGTDRCGSIEDEQRVRIYKTPRDLYGKIRLAPTMIEDHYMSSCKKTMELLIEELKKDEYGYTTL